MKRLAVAIAVLCFALAFFLVLPGFSHSVSTTNCTITVNNSTPLSSHLALAPGAVLCLHGGTYWVDQLQLMASGTASARLTLQSYPGEKAILKAAGAGGVVRVSGSYWTLLNLVFDNNALMVSPVNIVATANGVQLLGSEVRNGIYFGVEVWGPNARLEGNTIHDFTNSNGDNSGGGERHCIATHGAPASGLVVRSNRIYNCWGDGIQLYQPNGDSLPEHMIANVLIENNTFARGTLAYGSNAIDIKGLRNGIIRGNDIGGYTLPAGYLSHPDQAALELHHGAQGVLIENNRIHDGYQGMEINSTDGGQLLGLVVHNNLLTNLSNYGIDLDGMYSGGVVEYNTLVNVGGNAVQVSGQGLVNSKLDRNLIINSGLSKVYAGTTVQNSPLGPNAWYSSSRQAAFVHSGDVVGTGSPSSVPGFGFLGTQPLVLGHKVFLPIVHH